MAASRCALAASRWTPGGLVVRMAGGCARILQRLRLASVRDGDAAAFHFSSICIRRPCKGHRRVWLSFLAVNPPFFPSHWSLRTRLKAYPNPGNRLLILHLLRHRFPTSISTSFQSHFGRHFELILNMHT